MEIENVDGEQQAGHQLKQRVKYKIMNLVIEEDKIYIPRDPDCHKCGDTIIMHRDVTLYENACADLIAKENSNILEIGFGLGISADRIQTHNPAKHVIIEINEDIYKKAIEWAKDKSNVEVILGDWKEVVGEITDKFDGVYNDADNDSNEDLVAFSDMVLPKCNDGCKLIQTTWGIKNPLYKKRDTYSRITLDEDTKHWYDNDTLDIIYFTLTNNNWV